MKTAPVRTKARSPAHASQAKNESADVTFNVSKTLIGIITILSLLIGVWGLVCLVSGCLMTGDLVELVSEWFSAVIGL